MRTCLKIHHGRGIAKLIIQRFLVHTQKMHYPTEGTNLRVNCMGLFVNLARVVLYLFNFRMRRIVFLTRFAIRASDLIVFEFFNSILNSSACKTHWKKIVRFSRLYWLR